MSLTENKTPKTIIDTCKMIGTEKLQELFPFIYSIKDVSMPPNIQLFSREIIFGTKEG